MSETPIKSLNVKGLRRPEFASRVKHNPEIQQFIAKEEYRQKRKG